MTHLPFAAKQPEQAAAPRFTLYQIEPFALQVVPGRAERQWMEETNQRFAYRCLPLSIANASGWEILSPCAFEAVWNGGEDKAAIRLRCLDDYPHLDRHAVSHFGHGTLTFHTGYLFRTDPGWATWVRGAPNFVTDGIQPLDGLVETDWLPFAFTMNWLFTRPGRVVFNTGDPIAFVTPVPHLLLDAIEPEIRDLKEEPALLQAYTEWANRRAEFNDSLARRDAAAVQQGWQRWYIQGKGTDGERAAPTHISKRKLRAPRRAVSRQQA